MSLVGRATSKGGTKTGGTQSKHQTHKSSDKSQRVNRAAADSNAGDEVGIKESVLALMETTCRSEEEVCSALHDCDNDIQKACDMLLEEAAQSKGQWQTNEKKKKKSVATTATSASGTVETEEWSPGDKAATGPQTAGVGSNAVPTTREQRVPSRGRSSGRPYRGRGGGGGGDAHVSVGEDGEGGISTRGGGIRRGMMGRGGGRGGGRGASRGGRGSRPPRAPRNNQSQEEGGWNSGSNNAGQQQEGGWGDGFPSPDDWDNEEWSGSLADTKVFTPSSVTVPEANTTNTSEGNSATQMNSSSDHSALLNSSGVIQQDPNDFGKQNSSLGAESSATPPPTIPTRLPQDPAIYAYTNSTHHMPKAQSPVAAMSGTLSAAQSQYLSQLTQKSETIKQDQRVMNSQMMNPQVYNTNYGVYGATDLASQRKPVQRARVPPPSKIPASAVEMPGDVGCSSIGALDVQFGALDFGSDTTTFLTDGLTSSVPSSVSADKYNTTSSSVEHSLAENVSGGVSSQQNMGLDSHQSLNSSSLNNDVSSYATNVSRSAQMLTSDSLSAGSGDQSITVSSSQYGSGVSRTAPPSASSQHGPLTVAGIENQLTGKSSGVSDVTSQQSAYSSYPGQVTAYSVTQPAKQAYHQHHGYPGNPYSQVNSSGTSFTSASSIASVSAYPQANTLNQYQHVAHTQPLNTYQNSSSVSVYGGSGLYTASSVGVPYNNYQTIQNNTSKLSSNVKDSQYDAAVTSATNNLTNSQTAQSSQTSSSKLSTTSGKSSGSSGSTSVMNTGSAGTSGHVGAVMGQYIMGQHFYTQQPVQAYTYEDMQLIQRLPHHLPYYDVGYGSGGSGGGAGARDPPLASFASLNTGTPDTRFGRAEAPSPQAVAGAGAGAGAAQPPQANLPPYAYYYGGGMLPAGSYQPYSTTPIYPIATAGGTGSSSYGTGKGVGVSGGAAYVGGAGGGYGTPAPSSAPPPQPYESVQQQTSQTHQQDYKSGGGYSSSQQQSGLKQGVSNSANNSADLNNSMYGGKGHVSLNKSYDKAYHNPTPPPPFGLGTATGGVTGVSGGAYPPLYIPHPNMPPQPQQHQMEGRVNNSHRRDNGTNNSRGGATVQSKQGGGAKPGYSPPYWNSN